VIKSGKMITTFPWQEVAGFSPDRAKKQMMKIGNHQQARLAFVMKSPKKRARS
jgi:hypothetical protein